MESNDLQELADVRALASSGLARSIRIAASLSLTEVAAEVGVAPSTVHRWETGARSPRGEAARSYARILKDLRGLA
jgi:DNA-binding transcriptional regulator YiaG